MSFILLGILNSQAAAGGVFTNFLLRSDTATAAGVLTDSSGNVIHSRSGGVFRTTSTGDFDWGVALTVGGENASETRPAIDSSGNVYVGATKDRIGAERDLLLSKVSSSGSASAARQIDNSDLITTIVDVGVDGSDNIYVLGQRTSSQYRHFLAKFNSSLTLQWAYEFRREDGGPGFTGPQGMTVTSGGDVFIGGTQWDSGGGDSTGHVLKVASDGSVSASYRVNKNLSGDRTVAAPTIGSSNIYFTSLNHIIKQTTAFGSGVAKSFSSSAGGAKVWADSSDNVYLLTPTAGIIAKFDSSLTLQWQRSISGLGTLSAKDIRGDSEFIYCTWNSSTKNGIWAKLSQDGDWIGTTTIDGTTVTIAASSGTVGSVSYDVGASTTLQFSTSASASSPTLTGTTDTRTVEVGGIN